MNEAERLTKLEESYAHLQRHIAEQDKVMLELSEQFTKLRKEMASLRAQVPQGSAGGEEAPDQPPPHY